MCTINRAQDIIYSNKSHYVLCECYLSLVVDEGNAQVGHSSQNGHQRLDGVAVDHRPVLFEVVRREAALVNNSANDE